MKKKLWMAVVVLGVVFCGLYFFVKLNPPLEIGTLASSGDYKSVVVGVGNKGIREVKILDVLVNDNEQPLETKVQVSHALQGFIVTENFNSNESEKYGFRNIEDTIIKVGTSPSIHFEKLDHGTATNEDEIYGVSVLYTEVIFEVYIKYSYLGITFDETVPVVH